MDISSILMGLILLNLIIAGPIPLSLCFTGIFNEKKREGLAHNLFIVFFFWCIIQISIGLAAGLLHLFNGPVIFTAEGLLFIVGLAAFITNRLNIKNLLKFPEDLSLFEKIMLLLAVVLVASMLWKFLSYPMGDSDTLAFHLPAMTGWFQNQAIFYPLPIPYPYNWEILCTLFFFPFGRDFMAALPNLLSWMALGLVIFRICRELDVKKEYAMAGALLILCIPEILNIINTIHIDLAFALFFAAGLYFLILFYKTKAVNNAIMLVLSIAMMMGIKTPGITYGALLIFCLLLPIVFNLKFRRTMKPGFSLFLLIITLILLPLIGGFWYIKNWIETGNPLAFVNVNLFGIQIFAGKTNLSDLSNWTLVHNFQVFNFEHWKILILEIIKRLQFPFIILVIFSLFSMKMLFIKNVDRKRNTALMIILTLIIAFMYCVTPFTADNLISPWIGAAFRYGFFFMIMIGILAVLAFNELKIKSGVILTFLIISVLIGIINIAVIDAVRYDRSIILYIDKNAFIPFLESNPQNIFYIFLNILKIILPYLILFAIVCVVWFISLNKSFTEFITDNFKKKKILSYSLSGIVFLTLNAVFLSFSIEVRSMNIKSNYGEVIDYIDKNVGARDTIGFAFCDIYYPLYGVKLKNRVSSFALNISNINSCLSNIKQARINYLAIGPVQGSLSNIKMILNSPFIKWLDSSDSLFTRVSGERLDRMVFPSKGFIFETDYFYRKDRGRVLYKLKSF